MAQCVSVFLITKVTKVREGLPVFPVICEQPQAIHRDMPIISLAQDRRPWP